MHHLPEHVAAHSGHRRRGNTRSVGDGAALAPFAGSRSWWWAPGSGSRGWSGLDSLGVATVGFIPRSLPSITLPSLGLVQQLLPGALGIALMSFTETIAAGRAFAAPAEPPIKANRELLATGAANLAGAFFGAMPAGGGTSQTAVVRAVGGRTQMASLVTAAAAAATMLLLAPLLGLLPQAVLAAIVIVYSVGLIQPAEFVSIRRIRRMEFRWALAAFLGVLAFGTLQGIVVAIVLSLIGLASQAANPNVYVIGRKRGADVLRPLSPEHPRRRDIRGPADPPAGGTALLRQCPTGRGSDPGPGRRAQAARPRARHEPGLRHRVFRPPDDDGGRTPHDRARRDGLAGRAEPERARVAFGPQASPID